jgi:hypothetical protein
MDEKVVPILHLANAATAVAGYERLGFSKAWEFRFDPDCPAFVSLARGRARLYLSEHRGDARPDTLVGSCRGRSSAFPAQRMSERSTGTGPTGRCEHRR